MNYGICIGSIVGLLTISACGYLKPMNSRPQAQIDAANSLVTRYGLSMMPTYDELRLSKTVEMKDNGGNAWIPWVDSYWPTIDKGLARRWGFVNTYNEPNQNNRRDFMLGAYFRTQQTALQQDKDVISLNLAPSEKFDIAYRFKKGLNPLEALANIAALEVIDEKQAGFPTSELDLEPVLSMKRSWAGEYLYTLSNPGSNSQTASPMTTESLVNWLRGAQNPANQFPGSDGPGADWSWEGICDGWAAASLMSEEPKHAVQIEIPSEGRKKSLFFTEGDIRALISRAWTSDSGNGQFFIGTRCNVNAQDPSLGVPVNADGRAISGRMKYQLEDGQNLTSPFTIVQDYPHEAGQASLYRIILEREWSENGPKYGYLIHYDSQGDGEYRITFNESAAFKEIEFPDAERSSRPVSDVELFGCWDINPASFHTVLVKNIADQNLGIIMDRSQSGQVWNQPISRADFKIEELRSVADLAGIDQGRYYRAPGTAYIAQVETVVYWESEPQEPLFTYTQDGQDVDTMHFVASRYKYTLEFDQDKRLIGGEWGDFERQSLPKDNPDFVSGYTRRSEPDLSRTSSYIREGYNLVIRKLYRCSLIDNPTGQLTFTNTVGTHTTTTVYAYSPCSL